MIKNINLASNPFRNRTLPYLIALLLFAIAGVGAITGFSDHYDVKERNKVAKNDIEMMNKEIAALKEQGARVQQDLTADQKALLVAAHKLVANKSFGWSRFFSDLESVLPGNVSASRINVQNVFKDGGKIKAELELSVLSRDYRSVMVMIDEMGRSGLFQAELRGQNFQKTDRLSFSEYTLNIIYTPRSGYSPVPGPDLARQQEGGE